MMPGLVGLIAGVLILNAFAASFATSSVSCPKLRRMQLAKESVVLVDVRPASEFAIAHIQGAVNVPGGELGSAGLPRNKPVVVYCPAESCNSAETAAENLRGMGYSNAAVLQGGMAEWSRKGYPLVGPESPAQPKPKPGRLPVEQARERLAQGGMLALDVRPSEEFAAGHLPGARNISLESLGAELSGVPKEMDILVYDRQAGRTRKASAILLEAGYRVFELPGGLVGWVKKGYELEVK
ncbi:MAG: rhodanese-like domain-containing protein [Elusimicrobia bacterium]|nr:rhodanese-like domain-containing protein [Elusimicrobiota bacterium]